MARVWNIPRLEVPAFIARLVCSLTGLIILGGAFVVNAGLATLITADRFGPVMQTLVLLGTAAMNVAFYTAAFRSLTPPAISTSASSQEPSSPLSDSPSSR
jgi:hypothetical protein